MVVSLVGGVQLDGCTHSFAADPGVLAVRLSVDRQSVPAGNWSSRVSGVNQKRILKNILVGVDVAVVGIVADASNDFAIGWNRSAAIVDSKSFGVVSAQTEVGLHLLVTNIGLD